MALQRKIEGLGIEDKVILLNGLRLRIQDQPSREPDFDLPDFFDEDMTRTMTISWRRTRPTT